MSTQKAFIAALGMALPNVPAKDIRAFMGAVRRAATTDLQRTGRCLIPGIGQLHLQAVNQRTGRNPLTGTKLVVPAKTKITFTAAKQLKESIAC